MRYKIMILALLLILSGCSDDSTPTSQSTPGLRQLKIGMQEVHFSQISEVEGWDFADINQARTLFDYMDDLKISRFRYTVFWTSAELYAKSNFVWTRHDELIQYLTNKNISLTVTLFGEHNIYDTDGSSPYPENPVSGYWSAWLAYVQNTVNRYHSSVDRWEIWNEPDFSNGGAGVFWKPVVNASDFTSMIKDTSTVIRAIDPDAKIVMGGVTNFNGYRDFLRACFDDGILNSIDEIGLHLYRSQPEGAFDYIPDSSVDIDPAQSGIQAPTTFAEEIASLRSFIDSYRPGFPVRNTEEGFHLGSGQQNIAQLKYLTRMILVEHAAGVEEITCFRLRAPRRSDYPEGDAGNDSYTGALKFPGLIDQNADNSFTPRPAYYGLKNMAQYLVNSDVYYSKSISQNIAGNTVRLEIFTQGETQHIAYWLDEAIDDTVKPVGSISITIEGIGNKSYTVTDIMDNGNHSPGSYTIQNNSVTFDNLPVTDYPFILHAN